MGPPLTFNTRQYKFEDYELPRIQSLRSLQLPLYRPSSVVSISRRSGSETSTVYRPKIVALELSLGADNLLKAFLCENCENLDFTRWPGDHKPVTVEFVFDSNASQRSEF